MTKLDSLRKIIREEMRVVLKEELSKLMLEGKKSTSYSDTFKSKKENEVPLTLNSQPKKVIAPKLTNNSMLNSLLNETAMGMQQTDDLHFSSHDVDGFSLMQRASQDSVKTGTVNSMLASSRPSAAHEMVQINEVPDFSDLMNKLADKGVI